MVANSHGGSKDDADADLCLGVSGTTNRLVTAVKTMETIQDKR